MNKPILTVLLFASVFANAQSTVSETFLYEGQSRHYLLYLPANYVNNSVNPLIIHFHGYSSNSTIDKDFTKWMPVADTAGFLVVYPDGLTDISGYEYWNVGWSWEPNTDDVSFVSALIDTIHARHNIDESRVYASGFSNGGFMCYMVAAGLSNKITAVGSVSGGMSPVVFDTVTPPRAVPIIEVHGTADALVPYDGSTTTFASVNTDTMVHFWAKNNFCDLTADSSMLPDVNTNDGTTVQRFVYSGGVNNSACELYRVIGGQHLDWPGAGLGNNGDFSACSVFWNFFKGYTLSDFIGIETPGSNNNAVRIFPQPASNEVNVSLQNFPMTSKPLSVTIFSTLGQPILKYYLNEHSNQLKLDVKILPVGYYLLEVTDGDFSSVCSLIKD
jgi:polyhydroxybutyrate depolymerase